MPSHQTLLQRGQALGRKTPGSKRHQADARTLAKGIVNEAMTYGDLDWCAPRGDARRQAIDGLTTALIASAANAGKLTADIIGALELGGKFDTLPGMVDFAVAHVQTDSFCVERDGNGWSVLTPDGRPFAWYSSRAAAHRRARAASTRAVSKEARRRRRQASALDASAADSDDAVSSVL